LKKWSLFALSFVGRSRYKECEYFNRRGLKMPLLVSPIDGQTPMQQIIRNGIEIDRCPISGGVWLDKGELEKLLGAMQEAIQEDRKEYNQYRQSVENNRQEPHFPHPPVQQPRSTRPVYRDDDYEGYDGHYRHKHGKPSKFKSLFDLFD
jgi:hypothetical protein